MLNEPCLVPVPIAGVGHVPLSYTSAYKVHADTIGSGRLAHRTVLLLSSKILPPQCSKDKKSRRYQQPRPHESTSHSNLQKEKSNRYRAAMTLALEHASGCCARK